jgi:5-deoxy-glucuronate isomerase
MPVHIRASANHNQPIVAAGQSPTDLCYFNVLRLREGQSTSIAVPGFETLFVVMSGRADVAVGSRLFQGVGQRADIWSGKADSVYAGTGEEVVVSARSSEAEIAVAGGRCDRALAAFRVLPSEVQMVDVGSPETHSHRRIFHVLGQNGAGRAGNLLVSELYADPGCWSGYPPHKHDAERAPNETDFQEVYHYRFRPESGFGGQYSYASETEPTAVMTRNGDTFLVDRGYHPTVTSPGHEGYIFTILVGRAQRSLLQYFDPTHAHLLSAIPGIQAMRDKFK